MHAHEYQHLLRWHRLVRRSEPPSEVRQQHQRPVRDLLTVNGMVEYDERGRVCCIVLNQAHCYARRLVLALQFLVGTEHVPVILGET